MSELLLEALQLTLVGMSMTFAAIGTLVLGMYLLTMLTKEKELVEEETVSVTPEADLSTSSEAELYLAAAAAASVAVAQAAANRQSKSGQLGDQWGSYIRSQQLRVRSRN